MNRKIIHITAAFLILCMGIADISMYASYVGNNEKNVSDEYVINEDHLLEIANADGEFGGRGSDYESGDGGTAEITIPGSLHSFTILEIVPDERKGVVGFTIGGCEPFNTDEIKSGNDIIATKAEMKQAYMDALINDNPGGQDANQQWKLNRNTAQNLWDLNEKIKEGGSTYPFNFEYGKTYKGYYKYVGGNRGVYCIDNKNSNPKIYSRFFKTGRNDYNYIFVYDQTSTDSRDLNVNNHARLKYTNNEKFLKDWLGLSGANVLTEKQKYVFDVITKTPVSVSLEDIEKADLILMNNANKNDYYKFALQLQNKIAGKNTDDGINNHFYSPENDTRVSMDKRNDFRDFEKVIRIYERVVVREDVAFVAEKNCCTTWGGQEMNKINTNYRKLMFMLFYVQSGNTKMAGRDVFSDFFKRYTSQPGEEYLQKRIQHLKDPQKYPVDYRAASLKRNNAQPTEPGYYYMHMTVPGAHVGHPLVLDKDLCITGAQWVINQEGIVVPLLDEDGNIIPEHDETKITSDKIRKLQRNDMWWNNQWMSGNTMFIDEGIYEKQWGNVGEGYYKDGTVNGKQVYSYQYAYDSMSNTTDYIYIDNNGRLIIDPKYSSDQNENPNYRNYWYCIDQDDDIPGYDYRRRKWKAETWNGDYDKPWPWDNSGDGKPLTEWLMHKKTNDYYDCNMHMWYDYYEFRNNDKYTTIKSPPFGITYKNQSLMEENGFFKNSWIKNALTGREIKRETRDDNAITETVTKNYYFAMNILNGDGVNKRSGDATKKNKTLYYNEYEKNQILAKESSENKAYIPINISLKSSCEIVSVNVSAPGGHSVTYSINATPTLPASSQATISGSGGRGLTLTRPKDEHNNVIEPTEKTPEPDKTPIHEFEGSINDVMYDWYSGKKNTKITVSMTVKLPDDTLKTVTDEITIVRRDFFLLD